MATTSSLKIRDKSFKKNKLTDDKRRLKLKGIFDKYDIDKDGNINAEELQRLLEEGKANNEFTENQALRILLKADQDGDNTLSFEEFVKIADHEPSLYATAFTRYALILVPPRYREEPEEQQQVDIEMTTSSSLIGVRPTKLPGFYERAMTACPPPITMILFSLIDVFFFLSDWYTSGSITTNGFFGGMFTFIPAKREQEIWRFVTYMFIHGSIQHIVTNVIVQIALGVPLELVHNWWRVTLVYFAGVLGGSLGTSVVSPGTSLVGASGGVYALIAAHVANVIMNKSEMYHPFWQLWTFLIFMTFDISNALYNKSINDSDNVGVWAHLFGGIAGLLVGIGIFRNLVQKRHEKIIWWISVTVYLLLMAGAIIHIFYPEYWRKLNLVK